MPFTETQIKIYALTKQIMDLSEKYVLTISPSDKAVIFTEINQLYEIISEYNLKFKDETK